MNRQNSIRQPIGIPNSAKTARLLIRAAFGTMQAQLKTTYPEWRRDRPVEATTTYRRRAGKVPIPGRFSCTIRDLSLDPSGRKGLSVSRSRSPHLPRRREVHAGGHRGAEIVPTDSYRTPTA
jgi:hypothetical protein